MDNPCVAEQPAARITISASPLVASALRNLDQLHGSPNISKCPVHSLVRRKSSRTRGLKGACARLALNNVVGLAGRGQRQSEGPLSGWIKIGLNSCVDPDILIIHYRPGQMPHLFAIIRASDNKQVSWKDDRREAQGNSEENLVGFIHQGQELGTRYCEC